MHPVVASETTRRDALATALDVLRASASYAPTPVGAGAYERAVGEAGATYQERATAAYRIAHAARVARVAHGGAGRALAREITAGGIPTRLELAARSVSKALQDVHGIHCDAVYQGEAVTLHGGVSGIPRREYTAIPARSDATAHVTWSEYRDHVHAVADRLCAELDVLGAGVSPVEGETRREWRKRVRRAIAHVRADAREALGE